MTTLLDMRTAVAADLRDTAFATFTTAQIDALINRGIDSLADVYPREIVSTFATVTSGTYSYAASTFMSIYRIDVYDSAGTLRETLVRGNGEHPDAGWEIHAGNVWLPAHMSLTTGDTLRAFGYGRYTQLAASTSVTDLDTSGQMAVEVFAEAEAFATLLADRSSFQQWQANSNNTDVTALGLAQLYGQAQGRWQRERARLRRMRK